MKNKNGKGSRLKNEVVDEQGERLAGNRSSWLGGTLELNQETLISQARSMSCELFLQTRLFPLIERRAQVDEQTLVDLLVEFKRSRNDLDVEFEIANVMARILNRFQWYLLDGADNCLPIFSGTLETELDLFISLADLDFRSIDQEVRDRLHSV